MESKMVSVIIPAYNRAYCISRAINSVINQTYKNIEIIIVDDGSEDNTQDIVKAYDKVFIRYIKLNKNCGPSTARNVGIKAASGDYIAFQDSDDYWYPDKLEKQLSVMESGDFGLVFCKFETIGFNEGIIPSEDSFDICSTENGLADILITGNRIGTPTILMKTCLINITGGFDEDMKTLEDWDFVIKCACNTKIGYVPEVLVTAYAEKDGVNGINDVRKTKAHTSILCHYWNLFKNKSLFDSMISDIFRSLDCCKSEDVSFITNQLISAFAENKDIAASIIVPVYNSEHYLYSCLESLISIPLDNIEILCIDDGSDDKSPEIINHFGQLDKRIKYIRKENSGYGDTVNTGIKLAAAEYISIVESDDTIIPQTYVEMLVRAYGFRLDLIKANYNTFTFDTDCPAIFDNISRFPENTLLQPDSADYGLFFTAPAIWSCIYKKSFLKEKKIYFLPTPGASFQDTSFAFKTFAAAERIMVFHKPLINYRQDNPGSSSNSDSKIFFVIGEFREIEHYIISNDIKFALKYIPRARFLSYNWNAERLSVNGKLKFWLAAQDDFKRDYDRNLINNGYWIGEEFQFVQKLITDFSAFCRELTGTSEENVPIISRIRPLHICGVKQCVEAAAGILQSFGVHCDGICLMDENLPDTALDIHSLKNIESKDGILLVCGDENQCTHICGILDKSGINNYTCFSKVILTSCCCTKRSEMGNTVRGKYIFLL